MTRLASPTCAVVVPALAVLLIVLFAGLTTLPTRGYEVAILEPEPPPPELEEPPEIEEKIIDVPDVVEVEIPTEFDISNPDPSPAVDFSPQPAPFDSVSIVKSPVIMRGIYGSRNPGSRGSALKRYGGGGATEGAVLRALRWLKKYQESDGSWQANSGGPAPNPGGELYTGTPESFTSLALLSFLAHGETPASEEFGETIEKALAWLLQRQGADGSLGVAVGRGADLGYSHPIAAYALAEAYALTKVPSVKTAAGKAIDYIIRGQHGNGGWDYHCRASAREDVSVTAWCVQALKAAKMGGLENEGMDTSMSRAVDGLTKVLYNAGRNIFTYDNRGPHGAINGGLTCAGVLSMQFLGAAGRPENKQAMCWLKQNASCNWTAPWGRSPIYYWYYTTQAMFHTGGETWANWNKQFSVALVNNQTVVKAAIKGPDGKLKDIGYWKPIEKRPAEYCQAYVYNTTLCALSLQVYYRYLPTFKTPEMMDDEEIVEEDEREIEVDIDVDKG
jgi:hypothetical protein